MNLTHEIIPCKDDDHWLSLREQDITSTDCAALFGFSPYATRFEMWHAKGRGVRLDFIPNSRTEWGRRLEPQIAAGAAEEHDWTVEPFKEYGRIPELRIGSSFDFRITEPEEMRGILELKNLDKSIFYAGDDTGWLLDEDGNLHAPPHIELQLQHQMLVAGEESAVIGALVGGNDLKLIRRGADPDIHERVIKQCAEFWKSVDDDDPPDPMYPADAKFMAKLYGYAVTGSQKDMSDNDELNELLVEHFDLGVARREIEVEQRTLKAKMLVIIDDIAKVTSGRYTISAGMIGGAHIEYEKKPYRNFRITRRKK